MQCRQGMGIESLVMVSSENKKRAAWGLARLPEWGWIDPLLALSVAPAVTRPVAEPDAAVLLPAFHLTLVDRAPIGVGMIVIFVMVVIHPANGSIGDILLVMEAVVLAGQELVVLEPVQGCIGFFEQVLAGITP